MELTLSRRLQEVRSLMGFSAQEMALRVGLKDRKSWERYERGETGPKAEVLSELVGLGVDGNWLLSGRGTILKSHGRETDGAPLVGAYGASTGLTGLSLAEQAEPLPKAPNASPPEPTDPHAPATGGASVRAASAPVANDYRTLIGQDRQVLGHIFRGVIACHQASALTQPPGEADPMAIATDALDIYSDLVTAYPNPEDRLTGVRVLLLQLARRLGQAALLALDDPAAR